MASVRSLQVKLVDFSCAQHVNKLGTVVPNKGPLEYTGTSSETKLPRSGMHTVHHIYLIHF